MTAGTVTPTTRTPVTNTENCLTMDVTCPVSGTSEVNLLFNGNQVATSQPGPTTKNLVCSAESVWTYQGTTITAASCEVTPVCVMCNTADFTINAATGQFTATISTNTNGCSLYTITCKTSGTGLTDWTRTGGDDVVTTYQDDSTASVTCAANGVWTLTSTDETLTSMSCFIVATSICQSATCCSCTALTFTAGDSTTTVTPTSDGSSLDARPCFTQIITCSRTQARNINMVANGTTTIGTGNMQVTYTAQCTNSQWIINNVATTSISCVLA